MLRGCVSVPGIAALTFALLMSARMGIFQETLYKQFGKHSKEALFYNVSRRVFSVAFTGQIEALVNIVSLLFSPARVTTPWFSPSCPKHLPPRSPLQPVR